MRASFAYLDEEELPPLHSGELEWLVRAGNTAPQGSMVREVERVRGAALKKAMEEFHDRTARLSW